VSTGIPTAVSCPKVGEIRSGKDLSYKYGGRYIYIACPDCGKGKWMKRRDYERGLHLLCPACAIKKSPLLGQKGGSEHCQWKGGRIKTPQGYIRVWLDPNSELYEMADKQGYVYEHRLVMAQHLGRCLLPSEVVHHINGMRDDNRIENLELFPSTRKHSLFNNACRDCPLRKEIRLLHWQVKEQNEQIRNLTRQLMFNLKEKHE